MLPAAVFHAVGYGDKVPVTILGRFIACMWMITGIILFGVINASIVLALSVDQAPLNLIGLEDKRLEGTTICSTLGAFEEYLPQYNHKANVVYMDTLHECYEALAAGEVRGSPPSCLPAYISIHLACMAVYHGFAISWQLNTSCNCSCRFHVQLCSTGDGACHHPPARGTAVMLLERKLKELDCDRGRERQRRLCSAAAPGQSDHVSLAGADIRAGTRPAG